MRSVEDMRKSELNRSRHVCPNQPLIHMFKVDDEMMNRLGAFAHVPEIRESVITEVLEKRVSR